MNADAQPILIVEDDEVTAELERRVLSRAGRATRTVSSVADAVALLRTDAIAVVLLDYHLPDGDPWSVVEVAQARVPRVPVIVVTAGSSERIASEALHHGVSEYLQKTDAFWIQLPELVERVAREAQAEESVRRSNALFQLISESATDLVASMDVNGVIQDVSLACRTMLGYERDEVVGRPAWIFVHPDDRERLAAAFEDMTSLRVTYRQLKKDGTHLWVESNASVLRDPVTGTPREIVGIIRDVHARKRAEDKFRALLEGSPEANVIVDRDGAIVLVNARAERLFGYGRDELLGQPFEALIAERSRAHVPELQLAPLRGVLELGARRKDGSEFLSEISVNHLESEGEMLLSSTILDISERKTLQDQHMLLRLGEQLPQISDPQALAQHVVSELGAYFDVSRCNFLEIDYDRGVSNVLGEFVRSGPSHLGEHPLSSFVPAMRRELEAGRVVTISDIAHDLRTADVYATRYEPIAIRALAGVPLMRQGRWAAAFFLTAEHVRHWTAREIQMLQALVERTWLWLEHVRTARALRDSERKYRHFIENTHEGVWEVDAGMRTRFVNPRMAQMLGYSTKEMLGKTLDDFQDDEGRELAAIQIERRKAGLSDSHEAKFIRIDGSALWVRLETSPILVEGGRFDGALAMVADITERRQAEQDKQFLMTLGETFTHANEPATARRAVIERLGRHLALDHCVFVELDASLTAAAVHDTWHANASLPSLAGSYPMERSRGFLRELSKGHAIVVHDTRLDERTRSQHDEVYVPLQVGALVIVPMLKEARLTAALVLASAEPRTWEQREIALGQAAAERAGLWVERLQNMAALRDMSRDLERRVEARTSELKAALKEKEVLLKEIHHRVKNNLQVISSMLNLQAMHIQDPAAQSVFAESQGRVQSIALVHETLYESQDLSSVNFAEYIQTLVTTVMQAIASPERNITTSIDADGVRLAVGSAIPCGLIINELVTNSLKHAFRNREVGSINVGLHNLESGMVELTVSDDGVGLPPDLDPRRVTSLGLDLVYTFAEQLGAEVQLLREHGTTFRFVFSGRHE